MKGENQQLIVLKRRSIDGFANLIHLGHGGTFDFIYIDGGHTAPEVISEGCMAWELLKPGGVLVFDDYLFAMDQVFAFEMKPKFAIDTFAALFNQKIRTIGVGMQYVIQKLA